MSVSIPGRFRRGLSTVVVGCLFVAGTARAAGGSAGKARGEKTAHVATPAEIAVARRLFHEASKLEKDQHWADAAKKLHGALDIKETPGLRYHLAYCEENMGQLVQALVDYDRAAAMISDGVKAPDVAARLDPARTALEKRVPMLTLTMPTGLHWTKLSVDGHAMAAAVAGQPIPLDPGQHSIQVSADGYKPFHADVRLVEGERKTLPVQLAKPRAAPATAAPAPRPSADTGTHGRAFPLRTVVLIGEGAVTLAGLGVGIGFTVARGNASSRADDAQAAIDRKTGNPGNPSACTNASPDVQSSCDELKSSLGDKDTDRKLATVGFIGAGVGAAATLATWLLWKPAAKQHALAVTVEPIAGGGMLGGVSGRF